MSTSALENALPSEDAGRVGDPLAERLLSPSAEAHLFWRLRGRLLRALLRHTLQTSRLRLGVLAVMSLIFWCGLFLLFAEGFMLLESAISYAPTRAVTVQAIYNVFFVALLAMLTFSSAIIIYSGLYRSEEVAFLLTTPTRAGRIVLHKFQEAVLFSGWGFLLLGSPMLIAYGVVSGSPWYYYAMLPAFMASFIFIPAGVGTVLCLLVVHWLPSVRVHATVVVAAVVVLAVVGVGLMMLATQDQDLMTPGWLDHMLSRLRFAEQRLLPSWWLSSGLLEAAHPGAAHEEAASWRESTLFLAVLVSNALLSVLLVVWCGERWFRSGYSRLQGQKGLSLALLGRWLNTPLRFSAAAPVRRSPPTRAWIDQLAFFLIWPLPAPLRLLIVKDLRLFRRDAVQWSQFVIFFGLLCLYFLNIRRFHYSEPLTRWMNMISFLNLAVVGLILSTFTTRFIFPMISLEGRRFWILGSLPVSRDTILWSKMIFACAGSVVPYSSLILLSDFMLGIAQGAPDVALIHQITCWVLCVGLSGIAVGLGARFPSLHEPSPSRIAAGFGGTLNLVLSGIFIALVVTVTAIPSYCLLAVRLTPAAMAARWWQGGWMGLGEVRGVVQGVAASLLIGAAATTIPLRMGFRAFRRLEF